MNKPVNFSCYDIYKHNLLSLYTAPGVYMISELKFQDHQLPNSWALSTSATYRLQSSQRDAWKALFPIPRLQRLPKFLSLKEWASICNACS